MEQAEFDALLADPSKTIGRDILWAADEDHSPTVEFRTEVDSDPGYPLFVKGSYNALAEALSYVLVHKESGRIYALDLGKAHRSPDGMMVGEKHKHRWSSGLRDKVAYVPADITASVNDPIAVWNEFCAEAKIKHDGQMYPPLLVQMDLI